MNILHSPSNIGGQLTLISRAQRKLGYRSDVMVFGESYLNYEYDYNLDIRSDEPIEKMKKKVLDFFKYAIETYNIFHFYFGQSLLPDYQDLSILKSLGKKIFFTYVGHDCTLRSVYMKHPINPCRECSRFNLCDEKTEDKIKRRIRRVSKYADAIITFNILIEHILAAGVIKFHDSFVPIDLEAWKYVGVRRENNLIKVAHAPTNRAIKGTRYVIDAVEKLKDEGYKVELILVEGISNQEAKRIYEEADIIVDQLLIGWHGGFAVECMALGKPVLCYIREDLTKKFSYSKKLPIISTHPFNLVDNLKMLIENPELREELGKKGREYVEEFHDSMKLAKWLCDLYETL